MRKILMLPVAGSFALYAAARRANLVAFGASLAVVLCCLSIASAQTRQPMNQALPRVGQFPVSSGQRFAEVPNVDAAYSVLAETSAIAPAAYHTQPVKQGLFAGNSSAYCAQPTDACSVGCDVSWYLNYDALWLRRENDERFSLSRNSFLPDFDYEFGGRYTVGKLLDCVNGWEASYVGPFDWERQSTVTGTGSLQSNLSTPVGGGYAAADIDAFNGADVHSQNYRARMNSFELNRRRWTWDVLSTMIGVRYVDYREDFIFRSTHATNGDGLLIERVRNKMLGAQIGGDLMFPVNLRTNIGIRGKAGVYANFDERDTILRNGGNLLLNAGDNDVDVAGLIEGGIFANYQIVPSIRLTAGYEFWYLPGVATIPEQSPSSITTSSGTDVSEGGDLFLHGGSVGVQVLY
jgi:hypothetical protein